ncbi:MAG TPA: hypothetical protein VIX91_04690 [Candidatus Acidoferrum sp.]
MNISDAQRDVRNVFLGGLPGQLVSSLVWLVSAVLATWQSPNSAIIALVAGGFFIFPLTQLLLRLMGRPASLPTGHPMNALGMQIAFTLPLNLPLVTQFPVTLPSAVGLLPERPYFEIKVNRLFRRELVFSVVHPNNRLENCLHNISVRRDQGLV